MDNVFIWRFTNTLFNKCVCLFGPTLYQLNSPVPLTRINYYLIGSRHVYRNFVSPPVPRSHGVLIAVPQDSDCRLRLGRVDGHRQNALVGREIEPEGHASMAAVREGLADEDCILSLVYRWRSHEK